MNLSIVVAFVSIASVAACETSTPSTSSPARPVPAVASTAPAEPAAEPATKQLPPDGAPLYDFLLAEIPDLVARVPCSCCPFRLAECYRGACPKTCGPCNEIGRKVYQWHTEGMSDDDIVARASKEYPRQ